MTQLCAIERSKSDLIHDKKMLRALIQLGAAVELFTIPLYMTSLYSIAGVEVKQDGSVFPYMGPNEKYAMAGLAAQRSYNAIYSVYIQEMLHLQLALNIGNVLGVDKTTLVQPNYPPKPSDPNWIPCLGELRNLNPQKYPQFADIKAVLGPLNANAVDLFLAIELPDEDSLVEPPTLPLTCSPDDVSGLTFGGIGYLYDTIMQYMDFVYTDADNKTLFEFCYADALSKGNGSIVQINQFTGPSAYSHMTLEVSAGASPVLAAGQVKDMIHAIISEGEGSSRSNNNFVSPNYRPDVNQDIETDALWGAYSHYARFEEVKTLFADVETWPLWREKKSAACIDGPWQWTDLIADHIAATDAQKALAKARAAAWNDAATAKQLNEILNSTFDSFLKTLNGYWNGDGQSFAFGAMQAISSRVTAVWAAGETPEFKVPSQGPDVQERHSCQGLNTMVDEKGAAIGACDCSTAVQHSCAGTNSCANQGGCGYAVVNNPPGSIYAAKDSPENYIPRQNSAAGNGGCGAPIPEAQVFSQEFAANTPGPLNGQPVWEYARELFAQKLGKKVSDLPSITTSNIRVILPPS